jgi:SanA protein
MIAITITLLILAAGLLIPRLLVQINAASQIVNLENAPKERVAIVFGAGLNRNGFPTPVLQDRVSAAAALYFAGKVEKLLLSGDNQTLDYNEPGAMKQFALNLGVPEKDIVLDYAGRRTYDTCFRALHIFGVNQALLVTQSFHLPRALLICNALGIKSVGVSADMRQYHFSSLFYWQLREIPATLVALWESKISHPLPVLGEPEPIFPTQTPKP